MVKDINDRKAVEKFYLHPSIDTYGEAAEYIRDGLSFELFQNNVKSYLDQGFGNLVFICTINNLGLSNLKKFWEYLLTLKQAYGPRGQWVSVTSEVLIAPAWQNINILPSSFQKYLEECIEFISANLGDGMTAFSQFELQGVQRALDMMKNPNSDIAMAQRNFYRFFAEYDQRRQKNILATFPEISEFWQRCKNMDNEPSPGHLK